MLHTFRHLFKKNRIDIIFGPLYKLIFVLGLNIILFFITSLIYSA